MTDDRRLVELIDDNLKPKPMSRRRQVAFRVAVEDRLEARTTAVPWRVGFALAATAAMAAAIWLSNAPSAPNAPVEIVREEAPAGPGEGGAATEIAEAAEPEAAEDDDGFLASYADPDQALEVADAADYLPDDYLVLAGFVDELDG